MEAHGGFNHNHQTYRIVTALEERYPRWVGLNLTYETLEGIVKHETRYDLSRIEGYDPVLRGSLEAQIANIADEMAYNAHDLDDGLRAGLLEPRQLERLDIWRRVSDSIGWDGTAFDDMIRYRMVRRLIGLSISDVISATHNTLVERRIDSVAAVQQQSDNVARYSPDFDAIVNQLKDFLYAELYQHYRVVRMSVKAQRFIRDLFADYVERPKQLPPNVVERTAAFGLHRAVADYIAGMTDRFALQEWQRLYDPFTRP
jgi:dGTPase